MNIDAIFLVVLALCNSDRTVSKFPCIGILILLRCDDFRYGMFLELDCSLFVEKTLRDSIGMELTGLSESQLYQLEVSGEYEIVYDSSQFQAGDLIFYVDLECGLEDCKHRNEIHHVGIYAGDNTILNADLTEGVVIEKMTEVSKYFTYCAVRILK